MNSILVENEVYRMFERYNRVPNTEFEVRFGWHTCGRFSTDIKEPFFKHIHNTLSSSSLIKCSKSFTEVYVSGNTRIIVDTVTNKIISSHTKYKLETVDLALAGTPFDIRISVSVEKPTAKLFTSLPEGARKIRTRERSQFSYKSWNYDLTEVRNADPATIYDESRQSHECEIEYNGLRGDTDSSELLAKSLTMKVMDIARLNKNETIDLTESRIVNWFPRR